MKSFKTIKGEASSEFTEKHSKFICYAKHVSTKDEAENYIKYIKSKHWDAKHNVYAYKVRNENLSKSSDDGEPQGSAGIPILSVLTWSGLQDIAVVITRYFGGTLLGIGGLIKAYSDGAKLAIEACETVDMIPCVVAKILVSYDVFEKVRRIAQKFSAKISDCTYTNIVEALIYIDENEYKNFKKHIDEISCGTAMMFIENRDFYCIY